MTDPLDNSERVNALKRIPLLAGLPHGEVESMASRVTEQRFDVGAELIKEGTSGNSAYLIASGKCEVRRGTGAGSKRLAYLGPGEFFGELSILDPAPRTATVIAVEPTRVLVLSSYEFESAMKSNRSMAVHLARVLAARLRNLEDEFAPRR